MTVFSRLDEVGISNVSTLSAPLTTGNAELDLLFRWTDAELDTMVNNGYIRAADADRVKRCRASRLAVLATLAK